VNGISRGSILVCEECGERTVLDGPLSAWRSDGASFECECSAQLNLANGPVQEGYGAARGATNSGSPTPVPPSS
jgi:hypothetical protein